MGLQCQHNTCTFGDITSNDIYFVVTKAISTITNELMETFFDPHR